MDTTFSSSVSLHSDDDFIETPNLHHGEIVMLVARGIGVMVAIVAVVSSVMIMMVLRSLVAFFLMKWGISSVAIFVTIAIYVLMKIYNLSPKIMWGIITQSCS